MDLINEFDKDKLARINELAKIAKERELTEEELNERSILRQEFLENFRAGFRQQLSGIKVVHPDSDQDIEIVEEIDVVNPNDNIEIVEEIEK